MTIHGTNDTPTSITASSDGFTELAGTGNTAVDHAGGTITFTDVDLSDRPVVPRRSRATATRPATAPLG